jgi:tetratricopeptide (TPR) repeat protein
MKPQYSQWVSLEALDKFRQCAAEMMEHNKFSEALEIYKFLLERDDADDDARAGMGCAMAGLGMTEEGSEQIRKAFQSSGDPYFLGLLAEVFLDQELFVEAEAEIRQYIEAYPDDPFGWQILARCLREQGNAAKAEEIYLGLAVKEPGDSAPLSELGLLYFESGFKKEAVSIWSLGLAIFPEDDWLIENLSLPQEDDGKSSLPIRMMTALLGTYLMQDKKK